MLLHRLGPRITLLMAAAAVLVAVGGVGLSYFPMRRTVLGEAARQAQTLADVIHYSLEVSAPGTDELTMRRLVEKTGVLENVALVAVLDTDGRIRAASRSGAAVHLDLVREAMQRNAVRSREFSGRYALASPLHGRQFSAAHSDVSGVVYLELDMQPLLDELGGLYGSVLAVVTLLVGIMSLLAVGILRRLVINRLNLVAEGLSLVSAGQLGYRLPENKNRARADEIGDLTLHFNAMVQELQERTEAQSRAEADLQTAYGELEHKVAERTGELARANAELSAQMEERRQVEWRLQEHQLFLSTVLNGIQAGIFVFDPAQGRMVSSNSVAQALTHLSEEEISSGSCSQGQVGFVAGGRAMNLLCPDWSEQDSFLEGLVHLPDGRSFPASRQLMEIIIDGQAHLVQIVFDITERKNLERRLGMAQKLESIGLLAAGIAHEINTPVQYVGDSVRFVRDAFADLFGLLSAYAGLRARAAEGAPAGEDLRRVDEAVASADLGFLEQEVPKACDRAMDGLERVARIVQAMKNFSHPGSEEKKPTDINKAVQNTVIVARNEWKYAAEVETDLAPDLPLVSCYAADVNQVLLNMLVNSAHAIADLPGDGVRGRVTIGTRQQGESVEIRISDTGAGIPPENLERIFDPFFTTKPVGKGTGQGLTIAHDIVVNKHGGSIDVESEVGRGTTFTVRLPLETTEQEGGA
jgi:signal transduction histidine kinase/HAMP domain-containing protein